MFDVGGFVEDFGIFGWVMIVRCEMSVGRLLRKVELWKGWVGDVSMCLIFDFFFL